MAYDHLEINVKAVSAYKKSEHLGGTLAMSNLAKKLISAGFLDDAQVICDKAVTIKDYDKRVGEAISRIGAVRTEEVEKEEKVLDSIKNGRKFSIEFALAYRPGEKIDLPTRWRSPLCDLDIEVQDDHFFADGEYQVQENNLVLALANYSGVLPESKYSRRIVTYSGRISGRAIEYELVFTQEPSSGSTGKTVVRKHGLMAILKDKTEILVLEKDEDKKEELYSLKPIN